MGNLGQADCLKSTKKPKQLGMPIRRVFFSCLFFIFFKLHYMKSTKPNLNLGYTFWWQSSYKKTPKKEVLPFASCSHRIWQFIYVITMHYITSLV